MSVRTSPRPSEVNEGFVTREDALATMEQTHTAEEPEDLLAELKTFLAAHSAFTTAPYDDTTDPKLLVCVGALFHIRSSLTMKLWQTEFLNQIANCASWASAAVSNAWLPEARAKSFESAYVLSIVVAGISRFLISRQNLRLDVARTLSLADGLLLKLLLPRITIPAVSNFFDQLLLYIVPPSDTDNPLLYKWAVENLVPLLVDCFTRALSKLDEPIVRAYISLMQTLFTSSQAGAEMAMLLRQPPNVQLVCEVITYGDGLGKFLTLFSPIAVKMLTTGPPTEVAAEGAGISAKPLKSYADITSAAHELVIAIGFGDHSQWDACPRILAMFNIIHAALQLNEAEVDNLLLQQSRFLQELGIVLSKHERWNVLQTKVLAILSELLKSHEALTAKGLSTNTARARLIWTVFFAPRQESVKTPEIVKRLAVSVLQLLTRSDQEELQHPLAAIWAECVTMINSARGVAELAKQSIPEWATMITNWANKRISKRTWEKPSSSSTSDEPASRRYEAASSSGSKSSERSSSNSGSKERERNAHRSDRDSRDNESRRSASDRSSAGLRDRENEAKRRLQQAEQENERKERERVERAEREAEEKRKREKMARFEESLKKAEEQAKAREAANYARPESGGVFISTLREFFGLGSSGGAAVEGGGSWPSRPSNKRSGKKNNPVAKTCHAVPHGKSLT